MSVVAMESYCMKTAVSFLSQNYCGCFRYLALLKNREEFTNWLTRVVIKKFMFSHASEHTYIAGFAKLYSRQDIYLFN